MGDECSQLTKEDLSCINQALKESATVVGVSMSVHELKKIYEWMREPDYVEVADLAWVVDWMDRRPLSILMRLQTAMQSR
jgi:hypothetical protein